MRGFLLKVAFRVVRVDLMCLHHIRILVVAILLLHRRSSRAVLHRPGLQAFWRLWESILT